MPQIHGEADGAEVTIEGHVAAEFTEHAHDGRSDDGWRRWTGRRPFHGWPRCRRCGRVSGRGGDQEAIDGEQAARELRLGTLFFLAKKRVEKLLASKKTFRSEIVLHNNLSSFSPPLKEKKEERRKKEETCSFKRDLSFEDSIRLIIIEHLSFLSFPLLVDYTK